MKSEIYRDNSILISEQKMGEEGTNERRIEKVEDGSVLCICNGVLNKVTSCFLNARALMDTYQSARKEDLKATASIQLYCSRRAINDLGLQITNFENQNGEQDPDEQN